MTILNPPLPYTDAASAPTGWYAGDWIDQVDLPITVASAPPNWAPNVFENPIGYPAGATTVLYDRTLFDQSGDAENRRIMVGHRISSSWSPSFPTPIAPSSWMVHTGLQRQYRYRRGFLDAPYPGEDSAVRTCVAAHAGNHENGSFSGGAGAFSSCPPLVAHDPGDTLVGAVYTASQGPVVGYSAVSFTGNIGWANYSGYRVDHHDGGVWFFIPCLLPTMPHDSYPDGARGVEVEDWGFISSGSGKVWLSNTSDLDASSPLAFNARLGIDTDLDWTPVTPGDAHVKEGQATHSFSGTAPAVGQIVQVGSFPVSPPSLDPSIGAGYGYARTIHVGAYPLQAADPGSGGLDVWRRFVGRLAITIDITLTCPRWRWWFDPDAGGGPGGGGEREVVDEPVRSLSFPQSFAGVGARSQRDSFEPRPI